MLSTIGERARRAVRSVAEADAEARVKSAEFVFWRLREHMDRIRLEIEAAVLRASSAGATDCQVGYDGFSLREMKDFRLSQDELEGNGAVLELKHWAIMEGLRLGVSIEEAPQGAIGFHALKFPRLSFSASWAFKGGSGGEEKL